MSHDPKNGMTSVDLHMWEGPAWDAVRRAMRRRPCRRCNGVGVTTWDAFWGALGNIIGHFMGDVVEPYCTRCGGSGREPRARQIGAPP